VKHDYGPTTSTLLANQRFKYENLLTIANDRLFKLNGELFHVKRELKQLKRQLELSHEVTAPNEGGAAWHDE